jgi:hypothetical protein
MFCLLTLMLVCVGAFAQIDSTTVSSVTTTGLTLSWSVISSFLSTHVWTIIFAVAFILSEILASVKFTPKNSIMQVLWYGAKAILKFLANKKS